ncbi:MAG: hypothetical protein WAU82_03960 [Candidatus Binatus sp.]|uniref:hypothetical protein n=1 Tax=Candidatus Binatus sp. TaxID=2811406 RepID=UPI003BAE81D5
MFASISSFFSDPNVRTILLAELVSRLLDLFWGALVSAAAVALYVRAKRVAFEWREVIVWWSLLTFIVFVASVRFTAAQLPAQPQQTVELWPLPLTKSDIDNWANTLKPYHQKVSTVLIVFGDVRNANFAATLTQALSEAEWPEASIIPNQFIMGARIAATRDAWTPAQQLQKLIETKTGSPIRLDHYPDKDQTGKPNTRIISIYAGLKPVN